QAGMAHLHGRANNDALQVEGAEEGGRNGAAGHRENERGKQGAADTGDVGGLRGDDAAIRALAKECPVFRLGEQAGDRVGEEGGYVGAGGRNDPDDGSDNAAVEEVADILLELAPVDGDAVDAPARIVLLEQEAAGDSGEAEEPDEHGDEIDAAIE